MDASLKKLQILMSVYCGSAYLEEQIDSIFAQDLPQPCRFSLLIRDDGSADGGRTCSVIEKCTARYPGRIEAYAGPNLGTCGSFFDLVNHAGTANDYFAFADQDDFWLPDKIQRSLSLLETAGQEIPAVYSSQIQFVDENLRELRGQKGKKVCRPSFRNAMIENVVTGCTAAFNRAMLLELRKVPGADMDLTKDLFLHDWTLYLIAASFGKLLYDPAPTVLYRQHEGNVLGAVSGFSQEYARKFRLYRKYARSKIIQNNLKAFAYCYHDQLSDSQNQLIRLYLAKKESLRRRVLLIAKYKLYRQKALDSLLFAVMILLDIV